MAAEPVHLDQALQLALQLSQLDKVRLLERVAATLEHDMTAPETPLTPVIAAESETPTWTDEEVQALLNTPRRTPAEVLAWLAENPPTEPWGDLRDDEDAADHLHRMRRQKSWSTPADALPGDNV